jgi:hypothetical protein
LFGAGGKIENEKESGKRVLSVERGINVSCPRYSVRFRLNTLMRPVSQLRDVCGRANVHGRVRTLYCKYGCVSFRLRIYVYLSSSIRRQLPAKKRRN